ncbi:uncharacterized protein LOC127867482 [Dreissena polymorpha]|uniref:UPAR/Ly6 domain-containing protein qvr n=1 Tax=Dreissena polymorpha TaxID=45954 RepID=A0A9D4M0N1_DREPO|nr:uncharacterized protein LOC127867482 [Dreissena polymorpha]KAH3867189.1 hypothetical protein DPMN_030314 [Dreissena polymorpha]
MAKLEFLAVLLGLFLSFQEGSAIQCYQCDSQENSDLCPQETPFDTTINAMVDCNSFEANTPGQFCVKIYQESAGYGSWIKITRRCASQTDQGIAWGCRWSWDNVGVFRNTCYCQHDACNSAGSMSLNVMLVALLGSVSIALKKWL